MACRLKGIALICCTDDVHEVLDHHLELTVKSVNSCVMMTLQKSKGSEREFPPLRLTGNAMLSVLPILNFSAHIESSYGYDLFRLYSQLCWHVL